MRARLLLSTVFVAGVLTVPMTASAELPGYADLPSGHATAPPASAPPASIPANEKVPGFFVASPQFPRRKMPAKASMKGMKPPAPSYVLVVATSERAKRVESGEFGGRRDDEESGPCFSQERHFRGPPKKPMRREDAGSEDETTEEPAIPDWDEGLGGQATINVKTETNPTAGVTAVHREELVTDASGARLEIVDVWVDPATKGVRKIGASTIPLMKLGSTRGLVVYAARDERDDMKAVQFVVVPPSDVPNGRSESLVAVLGDGRNAMSSSCSHLRFAMNAAEGAADSAVLKATLRLPDRGDAERTDDEGEKRARVREAAVQLGVSRTKRDPRPVISLTFGWSGRETTQVVRADD
jgi:hypothetical protein